MIYLNGEWRALLHSYGIRGKKDALFRHESCTSENGAIELKKDVCRRPAAAPEQQERVPSLPITLMRWAVKAQAALIRSILFSNPGSRRGEVG